ncbi:MAG TPA: peptidyl-prolyl cis-trans isomerase, partial [Candidatus Acidoferrales bacterium]|nr:peptidyl-prolyl cis-trans isomerase [Candidatus Acidoferrales bacterium]
KRGIDAVETPLFAANDPVKGAEQDRELGEAAFKLEPGRVSIVPKKGAPYLVKLIEKQPSRVPPLKEIEASVRDALIRSTAEAEAGKLATKILADVKDPADLDHAAAANKLTVKNVEPFSRVDHNVPGIGEFPEVTDAAAGVPAIPGIIDRVMEHGGNAYIFEVTSRTEPTPEQWNSAQKDFIKEFLEQRRAQAWTRFLDELKASAKIDIDRDQLGSSEPSL